MRSGCAAQEAEHRLLLLASGALMVAGGLTCLVDQHNHTHDDGHPLAVIPQGPHSHPHAPDLHHGHRN